MTRAVLNSNFRILSVFLFVSLAAFASASHASAALTCEGLLAIRMRGDIDGGMVTTLEYMKGEGVAGFLEALQYDDPIHGNVVHIKLYKVENKFQNQGISKLLLRRLLTIVSPGKTIHAEMADLFFPIEIIVAG